MDAATNDLADRLRLGDDEVFADLFSELRPRITRVIGLRMPEQLASRLDPDDIVQDAYVTAAQRLADFRATEASAFVWLRTLALQVLIDAVRRHLGAQQRSAELEISMDHEVTHSRFTAFAAGFVGALTSPSRAAIRVELVEKLRDVFTGMSELDREILTLRHFEQLSNVEAAEVLSIDASAATKRYIRALRRFKEQVERDPELADHLDS